MTTSESQKILETVISVQKKIQANTGAYVHLKGGASDRLTSVLIPCALAGIAGAMLVRRSRGERGAALRCRWGARCGGLGGASSARFMPANPTLAAEHRLTLAPITHTLPHPQLRGYANMYRGTGACGGAELHCGVCQPAFGPDSTCCLVRMHTPRSVPPSPRL